MAIYVCSLKVETPQVIPSGEEYRLVRFPYGNAEPYDAWTMHQVRQPDGYTVTSAMSDDRAGLIWPAVAGWATLTGMLYWDSGQYTEVRDRFVRDPLDLSTGYDSTATEDHAATPGGQYLHKTHQIFVDPATPLGLLVRHNSRRPETLAFAEFKLAIESEVAVPA